MEILDDYRNILTREPFKVITPKGYLSHGKAGLISYEPDDTPEFNIKTQADFLREYYPTGHLINDSVAFPNIVKKDPETGKYYVQPITRYATAFQSVIAVKHTTHLVGNDTQFELPTPSDNEEEELTNVKKLLDFKLQWLKQSMEVKMFEAIWSVMTTADTAIVGYIDKRGNTGCRTFSFFNGDKIFPHYDDVTGELELFARKYQEFDEDGKVVGTFVEIWDDEYIYRAKYDDDLDTPEPLVIKDKYAIHGYKLVGEPKKHGFPFIPVAYHRERTGPSWSPVQKNIEDFEEAFSYLAENNKAYGFPIFFLQGDGDSIDIQGDELTGAVKAVQITSKDGKAAFINPEDASAAFKTQLDMSYKYIYELSFTVQPPELKSGDLPGVAIQLLYSPAVEMAIIDAQKLQPFLDNVVKIVKFQTGYAMNKPTYLMDFPINAWIEPYVHKNLTELTTNLATAVQNGFISKQTASERIPMYAKNDEYSRIIREQKEKMQDELKLAIEKKKNDIDEEIRKQKAINSMSGKDVNTGGGSGRPNRSGRTYDENGNWEGRNNWDDWNREH